MSIESNYSYRRNIAFALMLLGILVCAGFVAGITAGPDQDTRSAVVGLVFFFVGLYILRDALRTRQESRDVCIRGVPEPCRVQLSREEDGEMHYCYTGILRTDTAQSKQVSQYKITLKEPIPANIKEQVDREIRCDVIFDQSGRPRILVLNNQHVEVDLPKQLHINLPQGYGR